MACFAMSAGVNGSAGESVGVWMAPVTAQVMITLLRAAFGAASIFAACAAVCISDTLLQKIA